MAQLINFFSDVIYADNAYIGVSVDAANSIVRRFTPSNQGANERNDHHTRSCVNTFWAVPHPGSITNNPWAKSPSYSLEGFIITDRR